MRLHLIRHPQPEIAAGICYGRSDVPAAVDPQWIAQLVTSLPGGTSLYSSPLQRCAHTADALAVALGTAKPTHDERLQEMHFGEWELRKWDDVPRDDVDAWLSDLVGYRPGNGESVIQVAERVMAFRDDLLKQGVEQAIVVCHAGTIRLLNAARDGKSSVEVALLAAQDPHQIGYGEVVVVDFV